MNSFCGKECGLCAWRERLDCAGCREGLGKRFDGPCGIAACCREKGHEECATCAYLAGCPRRADRDQVPQRELRRREAEEARRKDLAEKAPLLGKWLWRIFWLTVPLQIISLLSGFLPADLWKDAPAGLRWAELLLRAVIGGAQGFFLWKLAPVWKDYRMAALCQFAVTAAGAAGGLFPENLAQGWVLLLGAAVIAAGLCRDYWKFRAHAGVLKGVDDELAGKWRRLWEWTAGILGGLVVSIFLAAFLGLLGLLLLLALLLGLIVLIVLEMIYLWRTVNIFRDYQPPALPEW